MSLLYQIKEEISHRCSTVDLFYVDDTPFVIGKTSASTDSNVYLVLDTLEGRECVGHWLWEAFIYVPFFKKIQARYPNIKILMSGYKRYKEQFCEALDIKREYLEFNAQIDRYIARYNNKDINAELYYPQEEEYTVIVPRYTYLLFLSYNEDEEFRRLFREMKELLPLTPNVEKTTPCVYMIRSKDHTENYKTGTSIRPFHNLSEVIDVVQGEGIPIYDVKDFNSLKEQIRIVEKAKTIIVEHGSAWFINGILFSRNTHIIVLNKLPIGCIDLEDQLSKENGNTYEFIESLMSFPDIKINIDQLRSALKKRLD
jgi:hypothetical protein